MKIQASITDQTNVFTTRMTEDRRLNSIMFVFVYGSSTLLNSNLS